MIFQTVSKFVIAFVRLILGKVCFDGVTGPLRETDVRDQFDLKVILKTISISVIFLTVFVNVNDLK